MPAADVHKLASFILPPIKSGEGVHDVASKASPATAKKKTAI
jgi:hypothetical protein